MAGPVEMTIKGLKFASLGAAAKHFGVNAHTISKNRALYPNEPDKWVELVKLIRLPMPELNARHNRLSFIEEEQPKVTKRGSKTHTERRLKVRCDCGRIVSFSLQQWGTTRECKRCATARSAKSREIAHTASLLNKPLNPGSSLIVRARDWKRSGYQMCECTACCRPELVSVSKTDRSKNKTCGCSLRRHGSDNSRFKNLAGKTFADGKVKVLSLIEKTGDDFIWKALCTHGFEGCKGEFEVRGRSLTSSKQHSCGCFRNSLSGQSQRRKSPVQLNAEISDSHLIPREPAGNNRHNQLTWKCECTYGGPGCVGWWIGTTGQLSTRMTKSCGCLNNENLQWGGLRLKRCYEEPEFSNLPRFIYIASFDGGAVWKIGITDNLERRATALYDHYVFSTATTTGAAMAVERCALYRTRWAAPSPIPIRYKMEGGTEIRFQNKISSQTLQTMLEGLLSRAETYGWKELIEVECPLSTYMEPATYSQE